MRSLRYVCNSIDNLYQCHHYFCSTSGPVYADAFFVWESIICTMGTIWNAYICNSCPKWKHSAKRRLFVLVWIVKKEPFACGNNCINMKCPFANVDVCVSHNDKHFRAINGGREKCCKNRRTFYAFSTGKLRHHWKPIGVDSTQEANSIWINRSLSIY